MIVSYFIWFSLSPPFFSSKERKKKGVKKRTENKRANTY
jgi:hypothetical protein